MDEFDITEADLKVAEELSSFIRDPKHDDFISNLKPWERQHLSEYIGEFDMETPERAFVMEVSLTLFEVDYVKNSDLKDKKRIFKLSLPEKRGAADMSTDEEAPKMLIATLPPKRTIEENRVVFALNDLQKELNANIDHLKKEYIRLREVK